MRFIRNTSVVQQSCCITGAATQYQIVGKTYGGAIMCAMCLFLRNRKTRRTTDCRTWVIITILFYDRTTGEPRNDIASISAVRSRAVGHNNNDNTRVKRSAMTLIRVRWYYNNVIRIEHDLCFCIIVHFRAFTISVCVRRAHQRTYAYNAHSALARLYS